MRNKLTYFFSCILTFFCLLSCSSVEENNSKRVFYDDLGRKITLHDSINSVLSFSPSITEILFALQADEMLVGVSKMCNHPQEKVEKLPKISTYPVDFENVIKLKPDVILAVEGMISLSDADKFNQFGIPVIIQRYAGLDSLFSGILKIGKLVDHPGRANFLVDSIKNELQKLKVENQKRPKVLAITWTKPIYVYGFDSPFTDNISLAGGENAIAEKIGNNAYPEVSREYILKLNPDVIIGRNFTYMDSTFFKFYPELKNINAYKNKRIFQVNDDLLSRPSPRVAESVKELINALE